MLAATNSRRPPSNPEAPTVKEAGYPELTLDGLVGFFGRSKYADGDSRTHRRRHTRVVMQPDFGEKLAVTGQIANGGGPAEFRQQYRISAIVWRSPPRIWVSRWRNPLTEPPSKHRTPRGAATSDWHTFSPGDRRSMNVSGEFTVNAPRDVVFKALRDPNSFVRFVDGVHDLKEIDPTHYEAVFETKVAYLKFKFNVTVEVTRADEPSEIEAKIEGNPLGVVGRLTAKSITRLEDAGAETKVTYSVESTLAGKLGSIGQPVLRSKAKDMEKQFAARLRAAFARRANDPVRPRRADLARGGHQAAQSGRSDDPPDRRRHRIDADDEGRRVPARKSSSACARSRASIPASAPAPTGFASAR